MIFVFLPAYNEEKALPRVVARFAEEFGAQIPYKIVVLDDGSSDQTARVASDLSREFPLTLLKHDKNEGLGNTMTDGLRYLSQETAPGDFIVTLDCDDTHDAKYVHAALKKCREGFDLVILSRYQSGGGERGLSFLKSILSRGAGFFLKLFFPISGVQEYSCGYRVMRAEILKKAFQVYGEKFIRLPHMGFVVTPEILIKLRMLKAKIAEVPFTLNYDKKPTPSKNKPLKTIAGYFALLWLYWGRKIKTGS